MIFIVIIALIIISILWAVWSLRQLEHDQRNVAHVKKELIQGRVLFEHKRTLHHSSSSKSSDLREER